MNDEQIDILRPNPVTPSLRTNVSSSIPRATSSRHAEKTIVARINTSRRHVRREQRSCVAATVAAVVARIGPIHGLFADDPGV